MHDPNEIKLQNGVACLGLMSLYRNQRQVWHPPIAHGQLLRPAGNMQIHAHGGVPLSVRHADAHVRSSLKCSTRQVVVRAKHPGESPNGSACPFASLLDPPVRKRGLLEQLNLSADTFQTQRSILQGNPAARAPYLFVDTVLVGTADLARELLVNDSGAYDVDFPPHMLEILGRHSMGTTLEPEHMQIRKLFAPGFTGAEVERYLPRVQSIAERFAASWASAGAMPAWGEDIKLFTFEVICAVVAGIDWDEEELREMSALFGQVTAGLGFPITLPIPGTPYTRGKAARQQIIARLQPQIDKYRAALTEGGSGESPRPALLERWVAARDEAGRGLSDQQLHDNLVGLLVAGHDTTSSTLSIVLAYLDQHPAVAARVRQEQQEVAARYGPTITPAAMAEVPFTEAVVREVWRLHPVVPIVGRKVAHAPEGAALGPYKLSPGQSAWVGMTHILKSDPRWEGAEGDLAPDTFNPDRFLTPEGREVGAQLVFGAGARACLGERLAWADIKVLLAVLMRGYGYRLAGPADIGGFPFPTAKLNCSSFWALPNTTG